VCAKTQYLFPNLGSILRMFRKEREVRLEGTILMEIGPMPT
jgi:hypothetical protein